MIRKTIFILFFFSVLLVGNTSAQTSQQIGFVDSNSILDMMPERIKATGYIENLNKKYKDEMEVMKKDYNKKYSDFISYQTSMAENIRLRRMQELYELEKQINDFMKIAQEDVDTQDKELMIPLRQKVKNAIYQVGLDNNLICIYDLANPTIVFVTPTAVDITPLVKQKLGLK